MLLTRESGVEKEGRGAFYPPELRRRDGLLVAINCAAILKPPEATGLDMKKAHLPVQSGPASKFTSRPKAVSCCLMAKPDALIPSGKLLRVLQEREVEQVGKKPVSLNIRVVATSNRIWPLPVSQKEFP